MGVGEGGARGEKRIVSGEGEGGARGERRMEKGEGEGGARGELRGREERDRCSECYISNFV